MRSISFTISVGLLAAFYFVTRGYPTADSAAPYHTHILASIDGVPDQIGPWNTIDRPQPPPAAQQLLRPNALLTRQLKRKDGNNEYNARLIVVQTKDSRDMGGHYPPVCYPSSGWQPDTEWPAPKTVKVMGMDVPYQIYTFKQRAFPRDRRIKIYGLFAIPDGGFRTDIKSVRKAAEDYRVRPFGCAQIQVIVDADTPEDLGERIFVELMTEIAPLLKDLSGSPESALNRAEQVKTK